MFKIDSALLQKRILFNFLIPEAPRPLRGAKPSRNYENVGFAFLLFLLLLLFFYCRPLAPFKLWGGQRAGYINIFWGARVRAFFQGRSINSYTIY